MSWIWLYQLNTIQWNLYWETALSATEMWSLKTGGLSRQVLYKGLLNIVILRMQSLKTGGLSRQVPLYELARIYNLTFLSHNDRVATVRLVLRFHLCPQLGNAFSFAWRHVIRFNLQTNMWINKLVIRRRLIFLVFDWLTEQDGTAWKWLVSSVIPEPTSSPKQERLWNR